MIALREAFWNARLSATGMFGPLQEARRSLGWTPDQVREEQARRLEDLLRHAAERVPYYRKTLKAAGVVRASGSGGIDLAAFRQLPPLEKSHIRESFDELRAEGPPAPGTYVTSTGGSTGEPVRIVQDRDSHAAKNANRALYDGFTGYRYGEPFAMLWGAVRDLKTASVKARLGIWLRNELRLEAYQMTERTMAEYVRQLNSFRPKLLLAYAQSAFELANFAEERGLEVLPIPAVMTSATNLEPHMREAIQRVFSTKVYDRYGSREVGAIACENGDGLGLLTNPLTLVVEAVDPSGNPVAAGEPGELLVTTLANRSMPLIRYRIGDTGTLGPPAGGAPWPRVLEVGGRVTDIFYTKTGDRVYGGFFTRQFYERPWVAQFQVVQEDYERLLIRIVPREGVGAEEIEREKAALVAKAREALGSACDVRFEMLAEIPVGPTGKRRYTISHVGPPR